MCLFLTWVALIIVSLALLRELNRLTGLVRDEKEEEGSEQGQTNNKAKQHSTPKVVTFPKKN